MATITMRHIREGEVPRDGGTAIQDDPDRPVFRGNGPDDYVCVRCGNLLAASMDGETAARVHPAFITVLRQLTPDEVRIISTFQHDGPYPLLTVDSRSPKR